MFHNPPRNPFRPPWRPRSPLYSLRPWRPHVAPASIKQSFQNLPAPRSGYHKLYKCCSSNKGSVYCRSSGFSLLFLNILSEWSGSSARAGTESTACSSSEASSLNTSSSVPLMRSLIHPLSRATYPQFQMRNPRFVSNKKSISIVRYRNKIGVNCCRVEIKEPSGFS